MKHVVKALILVCLALLWSCAPESTPPVQNRQPATAALASHTVRPELLRETARPALAHLRTVAAWAAPPAA